MAFPVRTTPLEMAAVCLSGRSGEAPLLPEMHSQGLTPLEVEPHPPADTFPTAMLHVHVQVLKEALFCHYTVKTIGLLLPVFGCLSCMQL